VGDFDGRVAVVTGAASGLGRAVAERLAADGAAVVVADVDGPRAEEVAAGITVAGGQADAYVVDVSEEAEVAAMVAHTVDRFGRVDVLHNNAAALGPDVILEDNAIEDMDVAVWDRTMAVNLRGPMLGCKHVVPHMRGQGGGAIVSTMSVSAFVGEETKAAYACSKAGIGALTRHVANMYGADGIRINAVAPGLMITPVVIERLSERDFASFRAERLLERATAPADVANLVAFLASDRAACITGQVYVIDGGTLAKRPRRSMADWEDYLAASGDGR
jgi:NAD(P)-dependent dehydrogenase (short-subunit alcohol dehydrogenase family)